MRNFKIIKLVTLPLLCLFVTSLTTRVDAASSSITSSEFATSNIESSGYSLPGPKYPLIQDSYFTDDHGNILMIVNVLGEVNRSGQIVVQEDADFATILTLAGGLKEGANQKKVLVARKEPDKNGAQGYIVDLSKFFAKGDRSSFINLKPNDTIIIPEKGLSLEKITRIFGVAVTGVTGWYYIKNL
jgi:hypothetical protein